MVTNLQRALILSSAFLPLTAIAQTSRPATADEAARPEVVHRLRLLERIPLQVQDPPVRPPRNPEERTTRIWSALVTDDDKLIIADASGWRLRIFSSLSEKAVDVSLSKFEINGLEFFPECMSSLSNEELAIAYRSPDEVGVIRLNIRDETIKRMPARGFSKRERCYLDPRGDVIWGFQVDRVMVYSKEDGARVLFNWLNGGQSPDQFLMGQVVPTNVGTQMATVVETLRNDANGIHLTKREIVFARSNDPNTVRVPVRRNASGGYMNKAGMVVLKNEMGLELVSARSTKGIPLCVEEPFASPIWDQKVLLPNKSNELWVICNQEMALKRYDLSQVAQSLK